LNLSPEKPRPGWKRGRNAGRAGLALGSAQEPQEVAAEAVLRVGAVHHGPGV
jgi:hypothetical protein